MMILQGRRKKRGGGGQRKGLSQTTGILETIPLFGPIAQQMCKGHFLDSQSSWVSTKRSCAL